ncbi:rhamnulokinase [Cohnella abietis]|uniref:Carbohydrate kinase n=1 Tax=Cohnella abietis TaxID=2507935 RepID=A0A3T1D0C8_9BACL|nr:rhamnulokinase family protein [Cohnella abietis]BBI31528.1 carbohydrate kinase [Cohnella abietis]
MSRQTAVLAFDLGAGSGRAFIGEWIKDEGTPPKLEMQEIHRFPNQAIHVGDHLHWDILRLLHEVKTGIRYAYHAGYQPESIGIDTWGVDFGLLDVNGELLGNPYHYRDRQTEGKIEEVTERIGAVELYQQTGLQNMPFNTIYQLYAMSQSRSVQLGVARHLLMISDLLAYLLTGRRAIEYTMATTTQLFHPSKRVWNTSLMDALSIPSRLFSEPIQPGDTIGPLTANVCEELGVAPIDVIAAAHDTALAVVAVPAGDEPFAYLVCGTWNVLGTELAEPLINADTARLAFSNEGGAFGTIQLLKTLMGLWIIQECKREWEEGGNAISYAELALQARKAPAFVSFINPDDLRFYPPHGMVGRIQAFCQETGQHVPVSEGEVMRCVIESLALRYRYTLEELELVTGSRFGGLHMVGGGIQNELLCQLTASAIGRPVWVGPTEASVIGNMLTQLIASGKCQNLADARRLVKGSFPVTVYEPQIDVPWEEAYERFILLLGEV